MCSTPQPCPARSPLPLCILVNKRGRHYGQQAHLACLALQIVKKIESFGSDSGKTKVPIVIADCGQLS